MSNSFDPDQARYSVGPDLGPNCLQRSTADDKILSSFQGCEWLTSPAVQHTDDPESSLFTQPLLHRQADHNIYEGSHKDGERTPDTDNN